jgi:hypothetical protein
MSAPEQRITRDDIEGKFREIQGEVDLIEDEALNYAGIAAVVIVTTVVVIAFVLGRRKGRKTRTVLEIRRI